LQFRSIGAVLLSDTGKFLDNTHWRQNSYPVVQRPILYDFFLVELRPLGLNFHPSIRSILLVTSIRSIVFVTSREEQITYSLQIQGLCQLYHRGYFS
jgi:hypothetical protein